MATLRINCIAIVLLCLISISYVAEARGRGGRLGRGGRQGRGGGHRGGPASTVFNVLQYGAKPNGKGDSSQAFMKAWIAACHWRGRARLFVPRGVFVIGPVVFQGPCNGGPITVQVMGTIKALSDISAYEDGVWVSFEIINGLILTGGGTFDGQGTSMWEYNDCEKNSNCQMLPSSIKFHKVTNANVRRIHSLNSMGFHLVINNCDNFGAQSLTITAPQTSPNTDGIHISESNAIRISRSVIGTGDDCISIGQGTNNISISRITCGPGHGISVGSLGKRQDEKDVNGVSVRNCTFLGTDNGVRIKTWGNSPATKASHMYFQDLIMNNVRNPIIIDQNYCGSSKCNTAASRVALSDIHYTNIKGTASRAPAVSIMCSPAIPCQNVQMFDVNLKYTGKIQSVAAGSQCANVKVGYGGIQVPTPCR